MVNITTGATRGILQLTTTARIEHVKWTPACNICKHNLSVTYEVFSYPADHIPHHKG